MQAAGQSQIRDDANQVDDADLLAWFDRFLASMPLTPTPQPAPPHTAPGMQPSVASTPGMSPAVPAAIRPLPPFTLRQNRKTGGSLVPFAIAPSDDGAYRTSKNVIELVIPLDASQRDQFLGLSVDSVVRITRYPTAEARTISAKMYSRISDSKRCWVEAIANGGGIITTSAFVIKPSGSGPPVSVKEVDGALCGCLAFNIWDKHAGKEDAGDRAVGFEFTLHVALPGLFEGHQELDVRIKRPANAPASGDDINVKAMLDLMTEEQRRAVFVEMRTSLEQNVAGAPAAKRRKLEGGMAAIDHQLGRPAQEQPVQYRSLQAPAAVQQPPVQYPSSQAPTASAIGYTAVLRELDLCLGDSFAAVLLSAIQKVRSAAGQSML